jgi:signal transduction histidine kinase
MSNSEGLGWRIIDDILNAATERDVIVALLNAAQRNFVDSRYYESNMCPFTKRNFYVYREGTRPYAQAKLGYLIYEASLRQELLEEGKPIWETATSRSVVNSGAKRKWLNDFELDGQGWLDVPVGANGISLGLWAMNRPMDQCPSDDDITFALGLARIAGLKLLSLEHHRVESATGKLFADQPKFNLTAYLTHVANVINAQFLAVFRFDPVSNQLLKVQELMRTEGDVRLIEDQSGDVRYRPGECLTGSVWTGQMPKHIPDFAMLQDRHSDLISDDSMKVHSRQLDRIKGDATIRTILYERLNVPGAFSGLLRAINRTDGPQRLFTREHASVLGRLSLPIAKTWAVSEANLRLKGIWNAFSQVVEKLRKEGLSYEPIATAASDLGFPVCIVTTWLDDGLLVDAWSNNPAAHSVLGRELRHLQEISVLSLGDRQVHSTTVLGQLSPLFRTVSVEAVFLVRSRDRVSKRNPTEHICTFFAVSVGTDDWKPDEGLHYWEEQTEIANTLDILGQLAATARELARNRHLLYLAEEAIGTIAHEMRTPVTALWQAFRDLVEQQRGLLQSLDDNCNPRCWVLQPPPRGLKAYSPELEEVQGKANIERLLKSRSLAVEHTFQQAERAVKNALGFARMGGEVIEVDFREVDLRNIVLSALESLRTELVLIPGLRVRLLGSFRDRMPIIGDAFHLEVLFVNLIDNAIKYSHNPRPKPGMKRAYEILIIGQSQTELVDVQIKNWGLGISKHDAASIFAPFYRTRVRDQKHKVRGVGLGLSTCQKIVELHKGTITMDSRPTLSDPARIAAMEGYLTTFSVRLPRTLPIGRQDIISTRKRGIE